ncbi:HD-GYP domain-containing protein [Roseospira marina]|nr:HD domain-containing phosphohydrolase [Roseospira marina]MBB5088545.1 putative nucleotidyltransferase with HDIG domain [Roseospira marina]
MILATMKRRPDIIILDEAAVRSGAEAALNRLMEHPTLQTVPLLGLAQAPRSAFTALLRARAIPFLTRDVRPDDLLSLVSDMISDGVERNWITIEPVQRKALTDSVAMFRTVSRLVVAGETIPYNHVRESCASLVTAVSNRNVFSLLSSVKGHDNYSYVHSVRVATFLSHFGYELGLRGEELYTLTAGGLLHDIGKSAIPHHVLNKPGRLTEGEWATMRTHVDEGLAIIDRVDNVPRGVVTIAAQHHERLDGSGYPRGLKGADLNDLARLAAIVDVFGALTDQRTYKAPLPADRALAIMRDMTGHLDMGLVRLFQDMLMSTDTLLDTG